MMSRDKFDVPSPSPSTRLSLGPLGRSSRRASLVSLSSRSQVDKGMLSQALDEIHHSASQSTNLTTFDEFAPPPSSSTSSDNKSLAGELVHGGISGLYSRLKASVGVARDAMTGTSSAQVGHDITDNNSSGGLRPRPRALRTSAGTTVSSPVILSTPSSRTHSPLVASFAESHTPTTKASGTSSPAISTKASVSGAKSPLLLQQKSRPSIATSLAEPLDLGGSLADEVRTETSEGDFSKPIESLHPRNSPRKRSRQSSQGRPFKGEGELTYEQQGRAQPVAASASIADSEEAIDDESDTEEDDGDFVDESSAVDLHERKGSEFLQAESPHSLRQVSSRRSDSKTGDLQAKEPAGQPTSRSMSDSRISRASNTSADIKASVASQVQRPSLVQVSPSHLPGYKPSQTSSSDGLSSVITTIPAPKQPAVDNLDEESRASSITSHATGNGAFAQMRRKVLDKEFWMRDENAKDCFYCGDPFTTFRRKHHCRTCGQIFDAKCTSLVSGKLFGLSGNLRVCKPCEAIIYGNDDDSSFYSEDIDEASIIDDTASKATDEGDYSSQVSGHQSSAPSDHMKLSTPSMGIPMSRKPGEKKRRSAVVELDGTPTLARPSSSRSLRSLSGRPHSSSHKRIHSRHQHMRAFRYDDRAPFHRYDAEAQRRSTLPAFHHDNIIDPDLAPFMSDEDTSDEELSSIFTTLNTDSPTQASGESDRNAFGGLLAAIRKSKSRSGEKSTGGASIGGRDVDANSVASRHLHRHRLRNHSISSISHGKPLARRRKSNSFLRSIGAGISGLAGTMPAIQLPQDVTGGGSKLTRSSSMRGADAPAIELNQASLQHVQRLLKQLLQDAGIPKSTNWERALLPILLQCTDDVNPDVQNNDDPDIRNYIKLKKIPGGKPGDTAYVSGVVFSKNVALKSMPRSIANPRFIIITFPIEYARHQQHFMSLEPVIAQEREYLRNLVNRIAALSPHVIFVQRNVAGLALQFLAEAGITVVQNVKYSVLNAISRCTRTRMISSVDKLARDPSQVGHCENFEVKTHVHNGIKKTYIYLSGCCTELGCTIVLRGAETETLRRVKRIAEFMCFVVYNLRLETCLMRDEFVLIPSSIPDGALPEEPSKESAKTAESQPISTSQVLDQATRKLQSTLTESGDNNPAQHGASQSETMETGSETQLPEGKSSPAGSQTDEPTVPSDLPPPSYYSDIVEKHKTKILSASPFVRFMQPYLLMKAREQEQRLAYLKQLRDQYSEGHETNGDEGDDVPGKFELVKPEMVHTVVAKASKQVREFLHAVHNAEYNKALHNYQTQKRQWETYIFGNSNLFDPQEHQRISILYSTVNSITSTPCFGPEIVALTYYNEHDSDGIFGADCTLGQYVEELCYSAGSICDAGSCDRKMIDHHRQYVHGEGQMSVVMQKMPSKIKGLHNTILMWSVCRICGQETQVIPMSENTWKYSFGKYLELTFWSTELHPRAGLCPHDIHRNHVRYFGLNNIALRIQYDTIQLFEVVVPKPVVTWKVDSDLRLKNEQYLKIEEGINRFMASVKARLKSIHVESVVPEKVEACRAEVDRLLKRVNEEHEWLKRKLQNKYMTSRYYEIIPFNRAIRAFQERAIAWDETFAEFEKQYFPSEKDIRRLAALQLKKLFLERDASATTLASVEEGMDEARAEDEKTPDEGDGVALSPIASHMSPEAARDMLTSVVQEERGQQLDDTDTNLPSTPKAGPLPDEAPAVRTSVEALERDEIRHLDLAIPTNFPDLPLVKEVPPTPDVSKASEPPTPDDSSVLTTPLVKPAPLERTVTEAVDLLQSRPPLTPPPGEGPPKSRIPKPVEAGRRETGIVKPSISRTYSTPNHIPRRDVTNISPAVPLPYANRPDNASSRLAESAKAIEKRLTDRLGPKGAKAGTPSLIPRSVQTIPRKRYETRVSTLAKHFEQLSREFEKERLRERRQRAERSRQARAYPLASSKPIVEVYRDVHEAVKERDVLDDDHLATPARTSTDASTTGDSSIFDPSAESAMGVVSPAEQQQQEEDKHSEHSHDGDKRDIGDVASDADGESSDTEHTVTEEMDSPGNLEESQSLSPIESNLDIALELPKHEKTSLMKMLTSFWSERSASGWTPLDYPFAQTEHVWEDSDIIVREDEPSSIIALALSSPDYLAKLQSFRTQPGSSDLGSTPLDDEASIERNLLLEANSNIRYGFTNRGVKAQCKIFYAESFDALRRKCGVADRFVESLSRCAKWDSKGGKSKSLFLRTLDDRFILKSLSTVEVNAFFKFAPNYFAFTHQNLFKNLPSVIAKMFGLFHIQIKTSRGADFDTFMLVMENLFYDRQPDRRFDLKGSMRNRKIQSTGERDEVLLDENFVDIIYSEKPIFVREHTKKLLKASVWNDTLFLSKQNVMDYSLMAGFDERHKEIIVGIIDCIRTYTWDKKLETWIKDRGKNKPTITSPKDYRSRFRIAMSKYILQAPDCWHQFRPGAQASDFPARRSSGAGEGASAADHSAKEEPEAAPADEQGMTAA